LLASGDATFERHRRGHRFPSAQTFTDSGDRHQIASYSTFEQLDGVGWASLWVRDQIASGAKNPLKLSLISHKYGKYGTNIEWDERTSPFSPYI
jgi:hypothetical protein